MKLEHVTQMQLEWVRGSRKALSVGQSRVQGREGKAVACSRTEVNAAHILLGRHSGGGGGGGTSAAAVGNNGGSGRGGPR
jgi:hypothetical protein